MMDESQHRRCVEALFNDIAAGYDNEDMRFVPFAADAMLARLRPRAGARILDAAAGTGQIALSAAHLAGSGGRVFAVDVAEAMLDRAADNVARAGLSNVDFHVMDVEVLEFKRGYFDAVTCGFALDYLIDARKALAGWRRVLRPGGQVVFSSLADTAFAPMLGLLREQLMACGVDPDDSDASLVRQRYGTPADCAAVLEAAGYQAVAVECVSLGYHLRKAEDWWQIVWFSGLRALLRRFSAARLDEFKRQHLAAVEAHATAQGLHLEVPVLYGYGRAPAHTGE